MAKLRVEKFVQRYRIPVTEQHYIPTEDGFGKRLVDGDTSEHWVVVEIDLEAVVNRMGAQAVQSKGGKCRDGYVLVRRLNGGGR